MTSGGYFTSVNNGLGLLSAYGAGWWVDGLDRLVPDSTGEALIYGDGIRANTSPARGRAPTAAQPGTIRPLRSSRLRFRIGSATCQTDPFKNTMIPEQATAKWVM